MKINNKNAEITAGIIVTAIIVLIVVFIVASGVYYMYPQVFKVFTDWNFTSIDDTSEDINSFDSFYKLSDSIYLCGAIDVEPCYCKIIVPNIGKGQIEFETSTLSVNSKLTNKPYQSTSVTLKKENGESITHKRISRSFSYYDINSGNPINLNVNFIPIGKTILQNNIFSNDDFGNLFNVKNEFYVYSNVDDISPTAYVSPVLFGSLNYKECSKVNPTEDIFLALDNLVDSAKKANDDLDGIKKSNAVVFSAISFKSIYPDFVNISKVSLYVPIGANLRSKYERKDQLEFIEPYLLQYLSESPEDTNIAAGIYLDQATYVYSLSDSRIDRDKINKAYSLVNKAASLIKKDNSLLARQLYYLGQYSYLMSKTEQNLELKNQYLKYSILNCKKSLDLNIESWNVQAKACIMTACLNPSSEIAELCN